MGHAVQTTNSSSPQPPKTSANSPRSFLHRRECEQPDKKGIRDPIRTQLSALPTRCFSTESAQTGPSLRTASRSATQDKASAEGMSLIGKDLHADTSHEAGCLLTSFHIATNARTPNGKQARNTHLATSAASCVVFMETKPDAFATIPI